MARTITIDPVTRIEGHARITINLDDEGAVSTARFHVTQFRGFERLAVGRPFYEMPALMARICGICPVSHLVASAKACDQILAVRVPDAAIRLRKVLNLGQMIQSHALSFFYLASPDLMLGMDADPAARNLLGLVAQEPELARGGIRLRQFGQQVIERLAGKRIHPAWIVPGGVSTPLPADARDRMLAGVPDAVATTRHAIGRLKKALEAAGDEWKAFGRFPSLFMGLIDEQGAPDFYDGRLRMVDSTGNEVFTADDATEYDRWLAEAIEPDSYLKSPYYRPLGYPDGMYRVGPLARLNIAESVPTPLAGAEWREFRDREGIASGAMPTHLARLIEILYCLERLEELLRHPDVLSTGVRANAQPNTSQGRGVSEAPRGTLMHHYTVDRHGLITGANLMIATGHNSLAMNRSVLEVARHYVKGTSLNEGMLNRVEAVIRSFDPCLSCSTHAAGRMPLRVTLLDSAGDVLDERARPELDPVST